MIDDAQIREAPRRLTAAAPCTRVFLFGSHARGDAGPHSDLDILVIDSDVHGVTHLRDRVGHGA